jgi:hypothetical protein
MAEAVSRILSRLITDRRPRLDHTLTAATRRNRHQIKVRQPGFNEFPITPKPTIKDLWFRSNPPKQ